MSRRAAAVERRLAHLKAVQAVAHLILEDYEVNRPWYRGLINGTRPVSSTGGRLYRARTKGGECRWGDES
jgi:hypothetical protein